MKKKGGVIDFFCIGRVRSYWISMMMGIFFGVNTFYMLFFVDTPYGYLNIGIVRYYVYTFLFFGKVLSFIFGDRVMDFFVEVYPSVASIFFTRYACFLSFVIGLNIGNLFVYLFDNIFIYFKKMFKFR